MVIPLPDDTVSSIKHLLVTSAHKTLGSMTCPSGCRAAIAQMKEKAQEWLDKAAQAKMSWQNIWFLLDRQFWPKVAFGFCNNTASMENLSECL